MEVRLKKPKELTPTNLDPGQVFIDGRGHVCIRTGNYTVLDLQSNTVSSADTYTGITRLVNGAFVEE